MILNKEYDYIVVGSGPGGATVAKELAQANLNILILEKGPHLKKTGFLKVAPKAFEENTKKPLRSDGNIYFARACILGGSSYVAMGNAPTPPIKVFNEWGIDLSEELEWSRKELRVTPMPEEFMGEATNQINRAAASLGWEMKPTPKSVDFDKCKKCGLCMYGCPTGAKWTSLDFIDAAVKNGADLMIETEVTHVLHKNGSTQGVSALYKGEHIAIKGKHVIISAGGLGSPIILQNSGINDAGKGLAGDVFQTTYGFTNDVGMEREIILATYLDQLIEEKGLFTAPYMYNPFLIKRDIDGGYPEKVGKLQQIKMIIESQTIDTKHLIGMMTKIRDEMNGIVHNNGNISKHLTKRDKAQLDEAHNINRRILIAAGARPESIFTGIFESGHPCCTAAIGKIVDEHQETTIKNLFVSDASVFPSPLGMPPILTIVALSKRLSNYLLST